MELEVKMLEAERARARQRWRENALEAEITDAEERERRDEIKGGYHVRLLSEN